jgi:exopolyphosphatase/guanosine-5'-triphosphate,3'-diphosphate pyrophosphatase
MFFGMHAFSRSQFVRIKPPSHEIATKMMTNPIRSESSIPDFGLVASFASALLPRMSARRAVIDVGTNSVKLLVADVSGRDIRPVCEESKQTRLGQGFYETHRLLPESIAMTAQAVASFADQARGLNASSIRVIATSAARDALNAAELIAAVDKASGLNLEIISGEQEADWAFRGVTSDEMLAHAPLLILDIGGGSTEFILGEGDQKRFCQTFRLGTVRLLETIPHSDPPFAEELAETRRWLRDFIEDKIRPALGPALEREQHLHGRKIQIPLIGSGGTTTILARMETRLETYDRSVIESARLSLERVRWHTENLWSLPLARRQEIVGLPKKRADVILPGAAIMEALMESFGFVELRASTRGLRFAALM